MSIDKIKEELKKVKIDFRKGDYDPRDSEFLRGYEQGLKASIYILENKGKKKY